MSKFSFLHLYAKVVAASTLLLIVAGGLVTSTGSGLSVPDWPLSYGQFFPPMIGGIRFEHSHRLIAATVGLLTLALTILFWLNEKRLWVKGLAMAGLFTVILQALLGGLTVKYLLPLPVSVAHACLGQLFLSLIASLAYFTSREWVSLKNVLRSPYARSFQRLTLTSTVFIFLQLVAGATVRHGAPWGVPIHFFLAFFILIHLIFLNIKIFQDRALADLFRPQVFWLNGLLVCQLFFGLGSFFYKFMIEKGPVPRFWEVILTTAHQTNGAVILCSSLILALRSFRLVAGNESKGYPSDYLVLMKLRVTLAALGTTLVGYWMAADPRELSTRLFHVFLGAFLVGGGANALNQFFEHDADGKMKRTENRPLPSGRLRMSSVFWFGFPVALAGIAELYFFVNPVSAVLGALTFFTYVFCYTPLKKKTNLNTFVGAISGALPIVMGYAAGNGSWGDRALVLFLILFLWQIPHFFAIAWVYREDYRNSGLKMFPASDPDGRQTSLRILFYSALLVPATLMPYVIGFSGFVYLSCAILTGLVFIVFAIRLYLGRLADAKSFVPISVYYLFILMVFLVADKS